MDAPVFSCLAFVPERSVAPSLHVLVLGEQCVKDTQSGLEIQVHHICKKKQTALTEEDRLRNCRLYCLPPIHRPYRLPGAPTRPIPLLCLELGRGVTFRACLGLLESSVQHQFKGKGHIVHLPGARQEQGHCQ